MDLYKKILLVLTLPITLQEFFSSKTGKEYGVTFASKLALAFKFYLNTKRIPSATFFVEHLIMATKILAIPKYQNGVIAEFGTFKGASTANLSLICKITNRNLEVFDSFEGLPKPSKADSKHTIISDGEIHQYEKGSYFGNLKEVKQNIAKYGDTGVCNFHKGFFNKSLQTFDKKTVFAFIDSDLLSSLVDVIQNLWPLVKNGSYVFVHEAHHMEISSFFFDNAWWYKNFKSKSPGLVGAGSGLGIIPSSNGANSSLGYTIKNPNLKNYKINKQKS